MSNITNLQFINKIVFTRDKLDNLIKFDSDNDYFFWKKDCGDHILIGLHWLGVQPLYYSLEQNRVDIRQWKTDYLDEVGVDLYKTFGYIALGRTKYSGVSFLLPNECLRFSREGQLEAVCEIEDIDFRLFSKTKKDLITADKLNSIIKNSLRPFFGNHTILPLSGGYDSNFLLLHGLNFAKIYSVTYSNSLFHRLDREIRVAKRNSKLLNVEWKGFKLKYLPKYREIWKSRYQDICHDHGMYHFEFYEEIRNTLPDSNLVLSGILGDLWSGKHDFDFSNNISQEDFMKLFLSHEYSIINKSEWSVKTNEFFTKRFEEILPIIQTREGALITLARNKMILLNYLLYSGFHSNYDVITPFLSKQIVLQIFRVEGWENRCWQKALFRLNNLKTESFSFFGTSNVQFIREAYNYGLIGSTKKLLYQILLCFRLDKFFNFPLKKRLIRFKF